MPEGCPGRTLLRAPGRGKVQLRGGWMRGAAPLPDADRPLRLHRALLARGETVAAAESLTAGLFCATLATVPGASATLRGGVVVYATELKTALAGVPADLLAAHGPVEPGDRGRARRRRPGPLRGRAGGSG